MHSRKYTVAVAAVLYEGKDLPYGIGVAAVVTSKDRPVSLPERNTHKATGVQEDGATTIVHLTVYFLECFRP